MLALAKAFEAAARRWAAAGHTPASPDMNRAVSVVKRHDLDSDISETVQRRWIGAKMWAAYALSQVSGEAEQACWHCVKEEVAPLCVDTAALEDCLAALRREVTHAREELGASVKGLQPGATYLLPDGTEVVCWRCEVVEQAEQTRSTGVYHSVLFVSGLKKLYTTGECGNHNRIYERDVLSLEPWQGHDIPHILWHCSEPRLTDLTLADLRPVEAGQR
jgi:hypothetical protein